MYLCSVISFDRHHSFCDSIDTFFPEYRVKRSKCAGSWIFFPPCKESLVIEFPHSAHPMARFDIDEDRLIQPEITT